MTFVPSAQEMFFNVLFTDEQIGLRYMNIDVFL